MMDARDLTGLVRFDQLTVSYGSCSVDELGPLLESKTFITPGLRMPGGEEGYGALPPLLVNTDE